MKYYIYIFFFWGGTVTQNKHSSNFLNITICSFCTDCIQKKKQIWSESTNSVVLNPRDLETISPGLRTSEKLKMYQKMRKILYFSIKRHEKKFVIEQNSLKKAFNSWPEEVENHYTSWSLSSLRTKKQTSELRTFRPNFFSMHLHPLTSYPHPIQFLIL